MITTLPLFPILDQHLIDLLRSLEPADWKRGTRARQWTIKDIAAHLLDGNVRTLSISRDGHFGDPPANVDSYPSLVDYLNRLNADWVKAMARVSPAVLIDLLESSGQQYYEHLSSLDPDADAIFPVGWAGEDVSPNWFHIAREYTEKWHHQQQIREVVGREKDLESKTLYRPVLDTFMRALPHHYRDIEGPVGTVIKVVITGEAGNSWEIIRTSAAWQPALVEVDPVATITIHQNDAWKLLTKGLTRSEAHQAATVTGDRALGEHFLTMLSVMA